MARKNIGASVFHKMGVGGPENTQRGSYKTPSQKPQEAHRQDKIGVGVIYTNLAPITLSNKQSVKYPDIHTSTYTVSAMSNNMNVDNSHMYRTMGIGGIGGVVAILASSSEEINGLDAVVFSDRNVVHLAPTCLEYDSNTKYRRSNYENI